MPRQPDDRNAAQRRRQQRYRRRLKSTGTPEASAVDIALSGAFTAFAEHLRRQEAEARSASESRRAALRRLISKGCLSEHEQDEVLAELMLEPDLRPEPVDPKATVSRILRAAVALLLDAGYDPEQSRALVIRRLGRGGSMNVLDGLVDKSGVTKQKASGSQHITW